MTLDECIARTKLPIMVGCARVPKEICDQFSVPESESFDAFHITCGVTRAWIADAFSAKYMYLQAVKDLSEAS